MTIAAAVLLPILHISLRLVGAPRTLAWIRGQAAGPVRPKMLPTALQTAWAVTRASNRGLYRGNCLSRSATLLWLLRRQGIETDLQFGARLEGGAFSAHAWVELDGVVLNDSASVGRQFARFRAMHRSDPAAPTKNS